jgi:hypothetical protein
MVPQYITLCSYTASKCFHRDWHISPNITACSKTVMFFPNICNGLIKIVKLPQYITRDRRDCRGTPIYTTVLLTASRYPSYHSGFIGPVRYPSYHSGFIGTVLHPSYHNTFMETVWHPMYHNGPLIYQNWFHRDFQVSSRYSNKRAQLRLPASLYL